MFSYYLCVSYLYYYYIYVCLSVRPAAMLFGDSTRVTGYLVHHIIIILLL